MINKDRLVEILNNFDKVNIGVVGDVMLDDYIFGDVKRISPEAPVPIINVTEERFVLGGAANVVNNLSSLGANVVAFGLIGNDKNGERFLEELTNKNVEINGIIKSDDRPTIVKRRIISQNQQLLRLDWEDKKEITKEIEEKILQKLEKELVNLDAIILSDYNKGVLTKDLSNKIIELCNKNNKIVIVDPKPENIVNYKGATSITPNKKEALDYLNKEKFESEEQLIEDLMSMKKELNLTNLLLTRSEEGISLFEDKIENVPTFAKEVYDVTGAGDTVVAVFALSAAAGAQWYEAAKIANAAAGIVVGKVGTSTVTKEEIIEFY